MPLLDHFHPPLSVDRHWESLHAPWAGSLADALNRVLPERYFAEEQMPCPTLEIDVTDYWGEAATNGSPNPRDGATATLAAQRWSPPAPALTLPAVFADDFEVLVFSTRAGPRLVAAIELVSPRNKDRPEARRAFATKCASYLHQGIGLIVADIVTDRRANLHNETMHLLQAPPEAHLTADALYAVAYRPVRRDSRDEIDLWRSTFAVGAVMPELPLYLSAELCFPVNLEAAYMDACRRRRLI
jgi:hypothetical protein